MRHGRGSGPCSRRLVGTPYRRVVNGYHVTKGTYHDPETVPTKAAGTAVPMNPEAMLREMLRTNRQGRTYPGGSVPGSVRRRSAAS